MVVGNAVPSALGDGLEILYKIQRLNHFSKGRAKIDVEGSRDYLH